MDAALHEMMEQGLPGSQPGIIELALRKAQLHALIDSVRHLVRNHVRDAKAALEKIRYEETEKLGLLSPDDWANSTTVKVPVHIPEPPLEENPLSIYFKLMLGREFGQFDSEEGRNLLASDDVRAYIDYFKAHQNITDIDEVPLSESGVHAAHYLLKHFFHYRGLSEEEIAKRDLPQAEHGYIWSLTEQLVDAAVFEDLAVKHSQRIRPDSAEALEETLQDFFALVFRPKDGFNRVESSVYGSFSEYPGGLEIGRYRLRLHVDDMEQGLRQTTRKLSHLIIAKAVAEAWKQEQLPQDETVASTTRDYIRRFDAGDSLHIEAVKKQDVLLSVTSEDARCGIPLASRTQRFAAADFIFPITARAPLPGIGTEAGAA
jgi:hypothetical protein